MTMSPIYAMRRPTKLRRFIWNACPVSFGVALFGAAVFSSLVFYFERKNFIRFIWATTLSIYSHNAAHPFHRAPHTANLLCEFVLDAVAMWFV